MKTKKEPEAIQTESSETENKEPALQKSEVVESAAELSSDSAVQEQQEKAEEAGASIPGERKEQTYEQSTPDEITVAAIDETTGENGKMAEEKSVAAKEHASQFSGASDKQGIDAYALISPDVALPGIVPIEAVPEPENIKATETVVAAKAGEQETVSSQSEVSSEHTSDAMTGIKET